MTSPSSSPKIADPDWLPRQRDALMLANLLRVSKLTLLYGEAGAGKSTLLKNELLTLLRRRATDGQPQHAGVRGVIPFPDRRNGAREVGQSEVAVFFDNWQHASPLAALKAAIEVALDTTAPPKGAQAPTLAAMLAGQGRRHKARLLVILDGFEEHLHAKPDDEAAAAFAGELAEALNAPDLPAHFFISVRDEAQALLEPWRARVAGFGDRWLRIRHWQTLRPSPAEPAPVPVALASTGAVRKPAEPHFAPANNPVGATPTAVAPPTLVDCSTAEAFAPTGPGDLQEPFFPQATEPAYADEDFGVDLYLPLTAPTDIRPAPSNRVQALCDELLFRPAEPPTVPGPTHASVIEPTQTPKAPVSTAPNFPPATDETDTSGFAATEFCAERRELPPKPKRTPWMLWSLLVVAFAAALVYLWGDSLRVWASRASSTPQAVATPAPTATP